ncbi:MAG: acylphosphatase [Cytophagaceae bacterium]|nr:acylphosphatase [Cytophagaceae bacterium]
MVVHKNIRVSGKVQGVCFRASTQKKAVETGIKGIVKNEKDGSVYIEAEGTEEQLKSFIEWCNKGPVGARVDKLDTTEGELKDYKSFEIIR